MVCRLSLRKPYQLNILSFQPHSVNKFSIDIYANFPLFYALLLIQSETFPVTGCSLDRHFIPVQKKEGKLPSFSFICSCYRILTDQANLTAAVSGFPEHKSAFDIGCWTATPQSLLGHHLSSTNQSSFD